MLMYMECPSSAKSFSIRCDPNCRFYGYNQCDNLFFIKKCPSLGTCSGCKHNYKGDCDWS